MCHRYTNAEREIIIYQPPHPSSLGMGGNCTIKNLFSDWFQSVVVLINQVTFHPCVMRFFCAFETVFPPPGLCSIYCVLIDSNELLWDINECVCVCVCVERERGMKQGKWMSHMRSGQVCIKNYFDLLSIAAEMFDDFPSQCIGHKWSGKSLWATFSSLNTYVANSVGWLRRSRRKKKQHWKKSEA